MSPHSPANLQYCNALFSGITDSLFRCLQSVQNAVPRLVSGTSRCDHITPVLRELHWLVVTSSTASQVQISRARLQVSAWAHSAISDP